MMGAEAMGFKSIQIHFTDPQVCRNNLCGICPHDLFSNTVSLCIVRTLQRKCVY